MNQTNLALKKLQGIKPKGIKFNEQSKLEHLIKTGNRIVADFSPKYKGNGGGSEMENLHFQIFSELKNNSLSNFKFDIFEVSNLQVLILIFISSVCSAVHVEAFCDKNSEPAYG